MTPLLASAAAFTLGIVTFYYGMRLARRVGYVDRPGGRKKHVGGTPPIGGLIIVPVFTLFYYLYVPDAIHDWPLFAGLFALLGLGVWDDRFSPNPWIKFLGQIAIATFVVMVGGAELQSLGNLWGSGPVYLGWLSVPFSVACLVLLINALNMIDGLDGLAGGITASILIWLMIACGLAGLGRPLVGMGMLLAPLLSFLFFNIRHPGRKKAAVFLGDAGSMTLALALGWFAIHLSQGGHTPVLPVTVIWLMAVPVIDTLTLFILRLSKKRHPFSADRNHLHHRMLAYDIPVHWTVALMVLATFGAGMIGMAGTQAGISDLSLLLLWLGILVGYIGFSLRPSADRTFDDHGSRR